MYVNPFWFGVLMTIVTMIVLSIVVAIIKSHQEDEEIEDVSEEEFRNVVEEMTGKKFRIISKDGYMIAESLEDDNESETK